MVRMIACVAALALCTSLGLAADKTQTKQNQMVKGTIKFVDSSKNVLVVSQQVKNEKVDRQLDILGTTEFEITIGNEKKTLVGKEGLALLEGKEGASVQVKCDKDVNVLKVSAKINK